MTGLLPPLPVALVGLFNLLLRATINVFFIAAQTLFFKTAGVMGLPYVYAAMNLVYIALQAGAVRRLTGSPGSHVQRLSAAFCTIALGRMLLPPAVVWLDTAFLLAVMVYELFFNQFFTHWLNDVLPLDEGKRYLPFINACGSLSFIVSGVTMRLALSVTSLTTVLAADVVAFAVAAACFPIVRSRFSERSGHAPDEPTGPGAGAVVEAGASDTDGRWAFGSRLAALALLFTLSKYWLDYQYSRAITAACDTPERLASFIAVFTSCTDALVLLTQMTVAAAVMKRFRLPRILAILPVAVGAAALASLGSGFHAVLATQFLFTWIAKSFHHAAMTLIVGILPTAPRLKVLSAIGIGASIGSMLSAVVLMGVQRHLAPELAFGALAAVLGLMALSVIPLERAWGRELGRVLDGSAVVGEGERLAAIETLRALSAGERLQRLEHLLQGSEQERLASLELMDGIPREAAEHLLIERLRHETSPRVRAGVVRRLVGLGAAVSRWAGADLLPADEADPRVLANLLEGLAELDAGESFLPQIRVHLGHVHHRVRAAAAEALIRLSSDPGDIEAGLGVLERMRGAPESLERAAAVAVLGRLQHEAFREELAGGLADPDERVASQAIAALRRLPLPEVAETLRRAAAGFAPRLAAEATAAAESVELVTCAGFSQIIEALGPEERAGIVNRLGDWRRDSRIYLVIRALQVEPAALRSALVAAIERISSPAVRGLVTQAFGQDGPAVVWKAEAVSDAVARLELGDLADVALLLRLLREHGATEPIVPLLLPVLDRIEQDIKNAPPSRAPGGDVRFKLAVTAASAAATEPARVVETLDRAIRGDRFVASLSWEYLELQLGTAVADRLARLVKTAAAAGAASDTIGTHAS
ncbi:MAG TPA: hypothetical protein PLP29_15265 [Candidatus Ozemobacteraceae bacterium]|nr:hypothetical protein [Candidatus Ozemobacteraceae bacterium]